MKSSLASLVLSMEMASSLQLCHIRRLQAERIPRLENIKGTSPIRKWRCSVLFRRETAGILQKLSRECRACQNRSMLSSSSSNQGRLAFGELWKDMYLVELLPPKLRRGFRWGRTALSSGNQETVRTPSSTIKPRTSGGKGDCYISENGYPSPLTPSNSTTSLNSEFLISSYYNTPSSPSKRISSGATLMTKSYFLDRVSTETLLLRRASSSSSAFSADQEETRTDLKRRAHLEFRKGNYKDRGRVKKISTDERVKKFLRVQRLSHEQRVLANRGIFIPGLANEKQNLGNLLHISEKYIRDLDMDPNQDSPLPSPVPNNLLIKGALKKVQVLSFKEQPKDDLLCSILREASDMVQVVFAQKKIDMDLKQGCLEDDFTMDVVLDYQTKRVMAVCQYVFMRKYVWIECFAVNPAFQRAGVGRFLMDRMKSIALSRRKDILLYSLQDVEKFYVSVGLKTSVTYPRKPWHSGVFMDYSR